MVGRSHLSIGEVLSLLHDEFPDVTISKIRFLESQGLVDPERTPSGYRKFYDSDIERLRWVLRQQRDAFLPLKVIKGRLDNQPEQADDETEDGIVVDVEPELTEEEMEGASLGPVEGSLGTEDGPFPGPVPSAVAEEPQSSGQGDAGDQPLSGLGAQLFDMGPPLTTVTRSPSCPRTGPACTEKARLANLTQGVHLRSVTRPRGQSAGAPAGGQERSPPARGAEVKPGGEVPGVAPRREHENWRSRARQRGWRGGERHRRARTHP